MSIIVLQRKRDISLVQKRFHEAGIPCKLSDIRKANYTETITPLLLDLFQMTIDPVIRLEIGIRLSFSKNPEVEKVLLKAFFEGVPSSVMGHDSFRWGVGNLLEAVSSKKSSNARPYLTIAKDKNYGISRQMVVLALAKLNDAEIDDVLISLLQDADVHGHAIIALGKRRVANAASFIRPFESHANPWIRKEAAKALRAIQR